MPFSMSVNCASAVRLGFSPSKLIKYCLETLEDQILDSNVFVWGMVRWITMNLHELIDINYIATVNGGVRSSSGCEYEKNLQRTGR